ncbi:response regulator [Rufibacter latericius]|uniref:Response regulator n=2 Tax=Rufibacter latericius TaxID=2487040 RepID=A0A3M9MF65_9BACT|nr:response regulator [Rufibacter latericius]
MDGFGFLAAIRNKAPMPHTPKVILLSSFENLQDLERAGKFQVRGFVSKPLSAKTLEIVLLGAAQSPKGVLDERRPVPGTGLTRLTPGLGRKPPRTTPPMESPCG